MYEAIQLTGGAELDRLLSRLPAEIEQTILKDALRAGALLIQQQAQDNCPVSGDEQDPHRGELKKNIKIRITTSRQRGEIRATIGSREGDFKGDTFYGPMVEFGHKIGARRDGKPLRLCINGIWVTLKPGQEVKAHPYLRPAYDSQKDNALQTIATEAAAGIERAAKK